MNPHLDTNKFINIIVKLIRLKQEVEIPKHFRKNLEWKICSSFFRLWKF